jgi:AraC family transcriptional regulator of arabinose operon
MEPRIAHAITLMSDLGREVSLTEIAQSINMSTSRLRHLFTDEVGMSPLQYLKEQRMRQAKELLETTHLNVKQIMWRVGIKDQSHFVRDFRDAYGLSPQRYRAQHLKANTSALTLVKVAASANK